MELSALLLHIFAWDLYSPGVIVNYGMCLGHKILRSAMTPRYVLAGYTKSEIRNFFAWWHSHKTRKNVTIQAEGSAVKLLVYQARPSLRPSPERLETFRWWAQRGSSSIDYETPCYPLRDVCIRNGQTISS